MVFNHGARIEGIAKGKGFTNKSYEHALHWFSDNWPGDLLWPVDIERPIPGPDSPAMQALVGAENLNQSAIDSEIEALTALNEKGTIANPNAFCAAVSARSACMIARASYDQVVRQYADGGPRADKRPRKSTNAAQLLEYLVAAGDVRFASRVAIRREVDAMAAKFGFTRTSSPRAPISPPPCG